MNLRVGLFGATGQTGSVLSFKSKNIVEEPCLCGLAVIFSLVYVMTFIEFNVQWHQKKSYLKITLIRFGLYLKSYGKLKSEQPAGFP